MSAHTPGPWKLWVSQDARPHAVFLRHALGSIEIPHWGYIGTSDAIVEEQLCNARLIAAAPEMLEALLDLVALLPDPELDVDAVQREYVLAARAVIAKATGEAA